jgi:hypothetical protein
MSLAAVAVLAGSLLLPVFDAGIGSSGDKRA